MEEITIDSALLVDDNTSVAVGFREGKSLDAIEKLLRKVFNQKSNNDIIEPIVNELKEQGKKAQTRHKENQQNDKSASIENQLKKLNAEEKNRTKILEAYLKTTLGVFMKSFSKSMSSSTTLANVWRQIDKSGVSVLGGMDAVTKSAYNLGMSYEEITSNLSKLNPVIAKLNGTMGNGLQAYDRALSSIPKSLSLSHDEQNAIFEATMNGLTASQIKSINSQEELNKRVIETAKEMKYLKITTGQSIEAMNEEQKARLQDVRFKQFEAAVGKKTMDALKATFDDKVIEYILSGGVANAGSVALEMANDRGYANVIHSIMNRMQQNNGHLTMRDIQQFIYQNETELLRAGETRREFARLPMNLAASHFSNEYQTATFGTANNEKLLQIMNTDTYKKYVASLTTSDKMLQNAQKNQENISKGDVLMTDLTAGGTQGASTNLGLSATAYGVKAKALGWLNDILPDGWLSGIGMSTAQEVAPKFMDAMMDKGYQLLTTVFGGSSDNKKHKKAVLNMNNLLEGIYTKIVGKSKPSKKDESTTNTDGYTSGDVATGVVTGALVTGATQSAWKTGLKRIIPWVVSVASGPVLSILGTTAGLATIAAASYGLYKYSTKVGFALIDAKRYKQSSDDRLGAIKLGSSIEEYKRYQKLSDDDKKKVHYFRGHENLTIGESIDRLSQYKQDVAQHASMVVKAVMNEPYYSTIKNSYPQSTLPQTSIINNEQKLCERVDTLIEVIQEYAKTSKDTNMYCKLNTNIYPTTQVPQSQY